MDWKRSNPDYDFEQGNIVIADKGFIDRTKTVFSINLEWGALGEFVENPRPYRVKVPPIVERESGYVLELGQDEADFSYTSDDDGRYREWLDQWPDRRVRVHPKVGRPERPLSDDLAEAGLVVGLNTSALVAASLAGVPTLAYGPHSWLWCDGNFDDDRERALIWIKGFEFDRRDPAQLDSVAAALADPGRAALPERTESPTPASRQASQKKRGKKKKASPARGSDGD